MKNKIEQDCIICGDWISENTVGVQRYAMQILLELDKKLIDDNLKRKIILVIPQNIEWENPFKKIIIVRTGNIRNRVDKYIWQQINFPMFVRKKRAIGIDLALALPIWGCDIYALHDCIVEKYPENFKKHSLFRILYLFKVKCISKRKKSQIVTVSENSKKDIMHYYKINPSRIWIVSNGWEHMKSIHSDVKIFDKLDGVKPENYFFSLGSKYKHKNLGWVLKAARYNPEYKFVLTGSGGYSNEEENLKENIPDNVFLTGYVSDEEMKALIENCKALIQPSLYEGFGIPPLEALSMGKKIIISDTSSLPEIYGESAYYLNPADANMDLEEVLNKKVTPPDNVLKKYSWEKSAEALLSVINTISGREKNDTEI